MEKIDIIKACSDFGVHKSGVELGPNVILENTNLNNINRIYEINKSNYPKEKEENNKRKNINYINDFNKKLYNSVSNSINNKCFPIILGGDHSISIGSALASLKKHKNLGIIWIDSHADFNTFETTITGNIHGLPFATIVGENGEDLTGFHKGEFYNPQYSVLVGARSIDYPGEYENLQRAGVTVFTTDDIKQKGMKKIIRQAMEIAGDGTNGMHISIDIDVLDPEIAPGVSVPEIAGINENDLNEAIDEIILKKEKVKSIDLVEYNPQYDIDGKTLKIAKRILNKIINLK